MGVSQRGDSVRIAFIELANFRKLKAIRIDFAERQTLFVGSNNSGKTSAMVALRLFLKTRGGFTTRDITLSNWREIDLLGEAWLELAPDEVPDAQALNALLPALDIWLEVEDTELHRVTDLLPTYDWCGGKVGVRLRLEPDNIEHLVANYCDARRKALNKLSSYKIRGVGAASDFSLWPRSLHDYFDRRFVLKIRAYTLDPSAISTPLPDNVAVPQPLPPRAQALEGDPLARLIHIREINAQRGFADAAVKDGNDDDTLSTGGGTKQRLSDQLQSYYKRHLAGC